jgi:3-oxoacyl-[acyl-carrier-protein] synthase II
LRKPDYDRRVVVTGLGVISSVGNDVATAWSNLVNGVSGLGPITRFDTTPYEAKLGGEVHDFDPAAWMDPKAARRSESSLHFGVAAAKQALADSGFEVTDENRTEVGVIFGSGAGGQSLMIDNYASLQARGPRTVAPTFIANALVDSCSGMIAIETGAIGHNMCVVSACATGTHSVGEAAEAIRRGDCIAVISGSTEAPLLEVGHAGFSNMRGMGMPRPGEGPETVSRPFDATRDGFVCAEGATVLVVESVERAERRGARIHAEVVSGGNTNDAYHAVRPRPDSLGVVTMMRIALEKAGIDASAIDYINPHGTSTPQGDAAETKAIKEVFGDHAHKLVISSTKSATGHQFGGAGSFEVAVCALALRDQIVPPTLNYRDPDPECDLDYVPEGARKVEMEYALSNSMGLGGHNGCVVLRRHRG